MALVEGDPSQPRSGEQEHQSALRKAADALGLETTRIQHHRDGDGDRLIFSKEGSDQPDQRLDFYPDRAVARYQSATLYLGVAGVGSVSADAQHLTIDSRNEASETTLRIAKDGATLSLERRTRSQRPEPAKPQQEPPVPAQPEQPKSAESPPRQTIVGRVGAEPRTRTTPKGTLVLKFPLAEHVAEDKTIWHTILAFGARAEKLKESVKRGDAVEVIGYLHQREVKGRDGNTRTVEEIYATAVKSR